MPGQAFSLNYQFYGSQPAPKQKPKWNFEFCIELLLRHVKNATQEMKKKS